MDSDSVMRASMASRYVAAVRQFIVEFMHYIPSKDDFSTGEPLPLAGNMEEDNSESEIDDPPDMDLMEPFIRSEPETGDLPKIELMEPFTNIRKINSDQEAPGNRSLEQLISEVIDHLPPKVPKERKQLVNSTKGGKSKKAVVGDTEDDTKTGADSKTIECGKCHRHISTSWTNPFNHAMTHMTALAFECGLCGHQVRSMPSFHMHFKVRHPNEKATVSWTKAFCIDKRNELKGEIDQVMKECFGF